MQSVVLHNDRRLLLVVLTGESAGFPCHAVDPVDPARRVCHLSELVHGHLPVVLQVDDTAVCILCLLVDTLDILVRSESAAQTIEELWLWVKWV